jgi:CheY-like chemotaxis protein
MPRLLLVDDNPSIHRIAESLLAPTDVELICVDSAAEALDRLERGERFDVALVDTAMPGMDGWTLLARLRAMEETARMPIALMAGVLDPVDPSKLAKAPIQGFLKKPIELRELGDRVKALLATPVPVGPSPFSTVPATPARDLVKRAEEALPELRPEPVAPPDAPEPMAPSSALDVADPSRSELEEDLLVLTAEDLWPEETDPLHLEPAVAAPVSPDVQLELEELDLDSLQDLTGEALPPLAPPFEEPAAAFPAFDPEAVFADEDETLVTLPGLDELEAPPTDFRMVLPEPEPAPVVEPAGGHEGFAHLPAAASLIGGAGLAAAADLALSEAHQIAPADLEPAPAAFATAETPAAGGQAPAAPGQAAQAPVALVSSEQAQALVQALLADPVLVDALVKAVVARMGDQVLREIAWEVMPDLAGRLQQ